MEKTGGWEGGKDGWGPEGPVVVVTRYVIYGKWDIKEREGLFVVETPPFPLLFHPRLFPRRFTSFQFFRRHRVFTYYPFSFRRVDLAP